MYYYSGLQDSDEEDIENDLDEQIETLMAAKRIVREVQASTLVSGGGGSVAASIPSKTATDKLELAKRLASRINLAKQSTGPVPAIPETSIGAISVNMQNISIGIRISNLNLVFSIRLEMLQSSWRQNSIHDSIMPLLKVKNLWKDQ